MIRSSKDFLLEKFCIHVEEAHKQIRDLDSTLVL
jgi:hypothetical protein